MSDTQQRDRDFATSPYTPEERRVSEYLDNMCGLGGLNDPIGFLLTSHTQMLNREKWQQNILAAELAWVDAVAKDKWGDEQP